LQRAFDDGRRHTGEFGLKRRKRNGIPTQAALHELLGLAVKTAKLF
jgi:hypothetical protein